MGTMDPSQRREFCGLLERQRTVYVRMAELVQEQKNAISANDAEALIPLAQQGADLTREAGVLQEEIDPLREIWESAREDIPEAERELLKSLMEEIAGLLKVMLASMSSLREELDSERNQRTQRLSDLQRGEAARRGYSGLGKLRQTDPRHMDRDG